MNYVIRQPEEKEYVLLNDFLYEAIYVPEGMEAPPKSIINQPDLQLYVSDFGRQKDDHCFVAEVEGTIVGAVWVRIMKDYGHIDDETPSAAISLYKEYRGHGIGTALMEQMLSLLRETGYKKVSLAVQKTNYALKMYEKAGFQIVWEKEEEYIMVNYLDTNLSIDKNMISLRPAIGDDIPVIEVWLNKEYIKKWYGEPEEWLAEIRNDSGEFGWLNHYIVMYENIPVGFCQYYDCSQTPKGFEWDNEPLGTFAIDYLIGEEIFLKKGLGSVIVQQLYQLIRLHENPVQIVADPVSENADSIKLLERNGFILDPATGLYKLEIK